MSSINPASQSVGAGGSNGFNVSVSAAATCTWTATSNESWLTIISGASGVGNGTVRFSVAANAGPARSGSATIGGQTFTVSQNSGCSYSIDPKSAEFDGSGGSGVIGVTTAAGCQWTAVANASWIRITSGAGGNGSGTVRFTVDAYSGMGSKRSSTITVAGETFNVAQIKKDD